MKINQQNTGTVKPSPAQTSLAQKTLGSQTALSSQKALSLQTTANGKKVDSAMSATSNSSRVTLSAKKSAQVDQAMLNQANQRLQMVHKKVKMLQKNIQAVSEHHGRAMMEQLKLLTMELKQAVTLFKRAQGNRSSTPNLNFGQSTGAQSTAGQGTGQQATSIGGLSKLAGGGAEKNSFQEIVTKVKGEMKALIRMAQATLRNDDERKDADKQLKKVDEIKLDNDNVSQQQLNLSLKISDAIGENVQLNVSTETPVAE